MECQFPKSTGTIRVGAVCCVLCPPHTEIPATTYESWNPFSFHDSDK